jgi:hypothetical protein
MIGSGMVGGTRRRVKSRTPHFGVSWTLLCPIAVNWTGSVITTLKAIGKEDWPHAFAAWNVLGLMEATLDRRDITVRVEFSDVVNAFLHCFDRHRRGFEPEGHTGMPKWQNMMKTMKNKRIDVIASTFDEHSDADFVMMRMMAILEA